MASMAGAADSRSLHACWGLRFLRVAKAVNRLSTFGKSVGEGSRLKSDLRVEAFWKVVEKISGFIRDTQASYVPKNESPLGVSGTATESLFSALRLKPESGETFISSTAVPKKPGHSAHQLSTKCSHKKIPSCFCAIYRAVIA